MPALPPGGILTWLDKRRRWAEKDGLGMAIQPDRRQLPCCHENSDKDTDVRSMDYKLQATDYRLRSATYVDGASWVILGLGRGGFRLICLEYSGLRTAAQHSTCSGRHLLQNTYLRVRACLVRYVARTRERRRPAMSPPKRRPGICRARAARAVDSVGPETQPCLGNVITLLRSNWKRAQAARSRKHGGRCSSSRMPSDCPKYNIHPWCGDDTL